jgi:hypothetical protein
MPRRPTASGTWRCAPNAAATDRYYGRENRTLKVVAFNIEAVYKTLADAGIVFVPKNGGGVGIRLRNPAPPAKR